MGKKMLMRKFGSNIPFDYSDARLIYSLRNLTNWTNAIIQIKRSSDLASAYVFFYGNTISLNSLISTTSKTSPSSVTLGEFVGINDASISEFYSQNSSNIIIEADKIYQETYNVSPVIIENGIILTKNGLPAFRSYLQRLASASFFAELNSGNAFSIFSVVSKEDAGFTGGYLGTIILTEGYRFGLFCQEYSGGGIANVFTSSGMYATHIINSEPIGTVKLLTTIVKAGRIIDSYHNGAIQETISFLGNYGNTGLLIGGERINAMIKGFIQEIIIFPNDKTINEVDLHNDINNYYSIY